MKSKASPPLKACPDYVLIELVAITPEIVVYRYSQEQVIESLKTKVTRLVVPDVFESSKTLIRALAKDGLMEDGKESLLDCRYFYGPCSDFTFKHRFSWTSARSL